MKITRLALSSIPFLALVIMALPQAGFAQTVDNTQNMERMDRIEHDLMLLQRQVSRGEPVSAPSGSGGTDLNVPAGGSAQLEVRLSAIEDQLRDLRGKIEENENHVRQVTEGMEKLQKDVDFRLNELANAHPAAPTAAAAPAPIPLGTQVATKADDKTTGTVKSFPGKPTPAPAETAAAPETEPKEAGAGAETNFASPREHYNYAFRLLNQTQYEEAAAAFEAFTKKYPKDPLVGNAYYWEGETFYIRRDYVNAADNFRKGFETLPEGPKAADNLLKLAMSLNALNRDKEACLVLQQITSKFKKSASSVSEKADQEIKRIGCHKT